MSGSRGVGALLFALFFVSCGPPLREPRAVRPESDVCAECRMTVVPEGHAAQSIDVEGQVLMFDDPGCLALFVHDHADSFHDAVYFVQDVETKVWVPWNRASFVRADEVGSPMNYGWHGFSTAERAQLFAQTHSGRLAPEGESLAVLAADLEGRRWRP